MESPDSKDEIVRSLWQQVNQLVHQDNLAAMEDHIRRIVLSEGITEPADWRTAGTSMVESRNPPPPHLHHHQPVPVQFYLVSPQLQHLPHLPQHYQSVPQQFQYVPQQFQQVPPQFQQVPPQYQNIPPEPESDPPLPANSLFRIFDPHQMSLSPGSGSNNSRSRRLEEKVCGFCKKNGESEAVYRGHKLRQEGRVVCPQLRLLVCELCGATGDLAHTRSYCPHLEGNSQHQNVSRLLRKTHKQSDGKIRRKFGK